MRVTNRFQGLMRAGGPTLTALLLISTLIGGLHHHAATERDDHCVVCTLAHAPATAPTVVAVAAAPVLLTERAYVARVSPPRSATRRTHACRAPPLS
jgi:hypothetical protein